MSFASVAKAPVDRSLIDVNSAWQSHTRWVDDVKRSERVHATGSRDAEDVNFFAGGGESVWYLSRIEPARARQQLPDQSSKPPPVHTSAAAPVPAARRYAGSTSPICAWDSARDRPAEYASVNAPVSTSARRAAQDMPPAGRQTFANDFDATGRHTKQHYVIPAWDSPRDAAHHGVVPASPRQAALRRSSGHNVASRQRSKRKQPQLRPKPRPRSAQPRPVRVSTHSGASSSVSRWSLMRKDGGARHGVDSRRRQSGQSYPWVKLAATGSPRVGASDSTARHAQIAAPQQPQTHTSPRFAAGLTLIGARSTLVSRRKPAGTAAAKDERTGQPAQRRPKSTTPAATPPAAVDVVQRVSQEQRARMVAAKQRASRRRPASAHVMRRMAATANGAHGIVTARSVSPRRQAGETVQPVQPPQPSSTPVGMDSVTGLQPMSANTEHLTGMGLEQAPPPPLPQPEALSARQVQHCVQRVLQDSHVLATPALSLPAHATQPSRHPRPRELATRATATARPAPRPGPQVVPKAPLRAGAVPRATPRATARAVPAATLRTTSRATPRATARAAAAATLRATPRATPRVAPPASLRLARQTRARQQRQSLKLDLRSDHNGATASQSQVSATGRSRRVRPPSRASSHGGIKPRANNNNGQPATALANDDSAAASEAAADATPATEALRRKPSAKRIEVAKRIKLAKRMARHERKLRRHAERRATSLKGEIAALAPKVEARYRESAARWYKCMKPERQAANGQPLGPENGGAW